MHLSRARWNGVLLGLAAAVTLVAPAAQARRGGSFGSRGSHTYAAPSATRLSPGYVGPISRSMSQRPAYAPQYAPSYGSTYGSGFRQRPGFGGGLLTGLVTGGLIGAMLGHHSSGYGYGDGGGGGMLALLLQLAIIGGLVWLVLSFFRRSRAPASVMPFSASSGVAGNAFGDARGFMNTTPPSDRQQITLTAADQAAFERLLGELQDAFGHGDFARLRAITTPEIMSYLAEELSENAAAGRRNDVSATRLLDAKVAEAWHEPNADYATIAMRYESVDVMRDRTTNAVVSGNPTFPTVAAELWTFVRTAGAWSDWKVSAIQET